MFGQGEATEHERLLVSLSYVKHDLMSFYKEWDRTHPNQTLSRLSTLTPRMLGISGSKKAEGQSPRIQGSASFCRQLLQHEPPPDRPFWFGVLRCCSSSCSVRPCIEAKWPSATSSCPSIMTLVAQLEIYTPKFHLMFHLILRTADQGNPVFYATFLDESLNSTLKKALSLGHQANFERLGLMTMDETLRRLAVRRRLA